jgi:hypothetical protein
MYQGYTDPDDGCAPPLVLSTTRHYTITAYLMAELSDNNHVFVRSDESNPVYSKVLSTDFTPNPAHSGPYNYCYPDGTENGQNASYLAAAAGFGLHRKPGGVTDEYLYVINHACDNDGSCFNLSNGFVYISPENRDNKYIITHEVGHWIGWVRNGKVSWQKSYTLREDALCPGIEEDSHDLLSMEEQRAAIVEGWAQFYAAATWNEEEENDCEFFTFSILDYDRDGQIDVIYSYSCLPGVGYEDTFCSNDTDNLMSTEYDWMRFFWMWHHGGKSISDLVEVIVDSNPSTWQCGTEAQCDAVFNGMREAAVDDRGWDGILWNFWALALRLHI